MRGGTSRGPYFNSGDLPDDRDALARVLITAMGAGSPLQVDGIGGGQPTTSKVAMLSASDHEWADVNYFFGQVNAERAEVDFAPSCGNMLAGVGPAALEMGLVAPAGPETRVRIHAVNTGALVEAVVQTPGGNVEYEGEAKVDGVPGTAAPVILNFMDVVGSKTGGLFPTGSTTDIIDDLEVTCIDAAMPMVIARAGDLGLTGYESPAEMDANRAFYERMEPLRIKAGELMGLGDVSQSVIPKIGILSAPREGGTINGRYFMPWKCHPSYPVTGSICTSACVLASGTVASGLAQRDGQVPTPVKIEHPLGAIDVLVDWEESDGAFQLKSAGLLRTARKLFTGTVSIPASSA